MLQTEENCFFIDFGNNFILFSPLKKVHIDSFGERVDGQHAQPAVMVAIGSAVFDVLARTPINSLMIAIVLMRNQLA